MCIRCISDVYVTLSASAIDIRPKGVVFYLKLI